MTLDNSIVDLSNSKNNLNLVISNSSTISNSNIIQEISDTSIGIVNNNIQQNRRERKVRKICGPSLIRMLEAVCSKAKELTKTIESHDKRQLVLDYEDPYARTVAVIDNTQFSNTLVGDCCLKPCSINTLINYC
ncbi:unnamed protein product [Didymodactylos carnosus]|uniref:Insulin-like domain-containing protein n=2 Tax=Didymodactylos carnosus TaxID=1234261 RepID=A0A8S2D065_9BILA|nr:unnamed protein product [Didymodactylos carnosus]CAF3550546.1 unnamed protein product [Didymodactylos carnosus]